MKRKISSNVSSIFQIVLLFKFVTLSILFPFVLLIISDLTATMIFGLTWLLGLLVIRTMGITKFKTIYWEEQYLTIGKDASSKKIPLAEIKSIQKTFLFEDFPLVIKFENSIYENVYFLPKGKFFTHIFSTNEMVEELKHEIRKQKNKFN